MRGAFASPRRFASRYPISGSCLRGSLISLIVTLFPSTAWIGHLRREGKSYFLWPSWLYGSLESFSQFSFSLSLSSNEIIYCSAESL